MHTRSLMLAGLLVAALVGCGDDEPERADKPELESSFGPVFPVRLRVVLATDREPAPDSQVLQQFDNLDCDAPPVPVGMNKPMAACDAEGVKYSLEPSRAFAHVESASASEDAGAWVVTFELDLVADARRTLEHLAAEVATTRLQVAVMRDGRVLAAPEVETLIRGGRAQVFGDFTEAQALAFAERLEG
ncbi:MAG: hypothetical protein Q8O61_00845 [Nocardioides sp.]|nr:hypothetical protein [Nocardioides sp.]